MSTSVAIPLPLAEQMLDLAIELTFPASDPISVVHAFHSATARDDDFDPDVSREQSNGGE